MADKFQNKYRIPPARLASWNYGLAASYFVTVCTDDRRHFFGAVIGEETILSAVGEIVEKEWIKTPVLRPDMNLELDAFCVMPNHFHAIIIIGENQYNHGTNATHRVQSDKSGDAQRGNDDDAQRGNDDDAQRRDAMHRVSTTTTTTTTATATTTPIGNKFGAQSKNLASIMRGFKSAVTVAARRFDENFKWQTRFHDHIIRNDQEFRRIRKYIIENPKNWRADRFFQSL